MFAGAAGASALTPVVLQKKATSSILLSTFVQYLAHSARRSSWTFSLLDLATDTRVDTLSFRSALNAVSLAHFAHTSRDEVFDVHASKEYGRALGYHRQALVNLPQARPPDARAVLKQALLTSTLLSYYELIAAVNPVAWSNHTAAAEQLLCTMGTKFIWDDLFVRQIAVSVRSHAVLRSTVYQQQTIFATEPWLEASREWTKSQEQSIAREAYDWILEWLLRISSYRNAIYNSNRDGTHVSSDVARAAFEAELQTNYTDFLLSLEPPIFPTNLPLFDGSVLSKSAEHGVTSLPALPRALRKQFTSMAFAYFHAAALLYQVCFPRADVNCGHNAVHIINVGLFLEQDERTNATGVLRMGFPFAMAWLGQKSDERSRQVGRTVFERWCQREGMAGLGVLIFR
ncbi:uncharacterized protein AB675_1514 [Cyphellophora attinorum]|uniref:Transcription factor domain-containing protein n=1 Tax=Cyphellophora attinorum TaxID=1664694 RepID=A0A0N0NK02_9EURO|nr:uncharacterized protein AB675_1514 [Phialophora attinorum]KPI37249.1 hypothetical protein AB675_1514 [Phialophora attinorum]